MVIIKRNGLAFRFPDLHRRASCGIDLQRTLRVPDDGKRYPLRAGLGRFPLRHIDDFAERLSAESLRRGGVIMPIYQSEALWLNFGPKKWSRHGAYPCAIKVATGKICAISGEPWTEGLTENPQNYVVVPGQPWLDGYCVEKGLVRQFVAMPLGDGHTVEERLTGGAKHGGLQIAVYPMRRDVYDVMMRKMRPVYFSKEVGLRRQVFSRRAPKLKVVSEMGIAPGGRLDQEIYRDAYGRDSWDLDRGSRCFVTMANAAQWLAITEEPPPTKPFTPEQYADAGLPWFGYYDRDREVLDGARRLASLKSVTETAREHELDIHGAE